MYYSGTCEYSVHCNASQSVQMQTYVTNQNCRSQIHHKIHIDFKFASLNLHDFEPHSICFHNFLRLNKIFCTYAFRQADALTSAT